MKPLLYYREDIRSIGIIALMLLIAALQIGGVVEHWAVYLLTFPLAFLCCVVNHNHQHHPTFRPRWLNAIFGVAVSLSTGLPASAIIPMHNGNHHRHNNKPQDYVRADTVNTGWRLLDVIVFPLAAICRYAPAKSRELRRWKQQRPRLHRQIWLERWVLYPLLTLVVIVFPWQALLYLAAPWLAAQWAILAVNHAQHIGCDPADPQRDCRDFTGRWLNWWVLNNGLHSVHHRRPGMHWCRLRAYHTKIASQLDPQLQCRSALPALWRLYALPASANKVRSHG